MNENGGNLAAKLTLMKKMRQKKKKKIDMRITGKTPKNELNEETDKLQLMSRT